VSLHSIRSRINRFLASSWTNPGHCNFSYEVINDFFVQRVFISSDTGHHQLEASLRSTRLQGLPEVGPARLLAAMLGDLGASTLRSIKTMTQYSSLFEHRTSHAACFNARGLLYECIFDALLFSSSYRPVRKFVSHHVISRPTFFSFLDHHTGHPTYHDACILLYECIFDAL
jgi:hypothetical protein